jgi:rhamnosyltransferase
VYLSQDASPADDKWLEGLLDPLRADAAVVGVCSRISPRPDCNPLLARQVLADPLASPNRQVILLNPIERDQYWSLSPFAKRVLVPFHNISSCIRRDVLRQVPFPDVTFAEDLAWAHSALLHGYGVAYNPASQVIHSHSYTPTTLYRRAAVDAEANWRLFGRSNLRSFKELPEFVRHGVVEDWQYTQEIHLRSANRIRWTLQGIPLHMAAGVGHWRGARRGRQSAMIPLFGASAPSNALVG